MHLHQVRPLQGYPQVQASRLQPDPPDPRVLHIQSERPDSLPLEKFSLQMPCFSEFIRIFAPRTSCEESRPFLLPLPTSTRSTLSENEADALLSCAPESGKFKSHTRRSTTVHVYTWACRLIVCMRGHSGTEVHRRGIRRSTFFVSLPFLEAPA